MYSVRVMWSVFLMLFLALSLQPVLSVPILRSLAVEEEYKENNINEKDMESSEWLKYAKEIVDKVGTAAANIPKAGPYLLPALILGSVLIPSADKIDGVRSEMNALNARLDYFNEDLKWAYNDYQTAIDNIENSWSKYSEMAANKEMLEKIFFPFYTPDSALVIHRLLTFDPVAHTRSRTTQGLGDTLAKRFRCHEKEVEEQFSYLRKLLSNGNAMDEKYYEFKKINLQFRKTKSKKIKSESASAMFRTQQRCVSNSELYIKRDIIERIDDTKNHQQIANNIGDFLKTTYDGYDWMVVAFTSHNSRNLFTILNRHVLSGFTEIDRGTVTVAVAHQIKGTKYTKAQKVKETLKACLKDVPCYALEREIQKCTGVSEAYSGLHVFKNHAQTYISALTDEHEQDIYSESFAGFAGNEAPIYAAVCPVTSMKYVEQQRLPENAQIIEMTDVIDLGSTKVGRKILKGLDHMEDLVKKLKIDKKVKTITERKFFVLLKSDEEMDKNYNPCEPSPCKNGGKCQMAPGTKIPMCECPSTHFGRRCENKFTL